jgi:hypothetical protein
MGKAKVTKKFSAPEWVVGVMGIVGTLGSFEHSARSRYLLYGVSRTVRQDGHSY